MLEEHQRGKICVIALIASVYSTLIDRSLKGEVYLDPQRVASEINRIRGADDSDAALSNETETSVTCQDVYRQRVVLRLNLLLMAA